MQSLSFEHIYQIRIFLALDPTSWLGMRSSEMLDRAIILLKPVATFWVTASVVSSSEEIQIRAKHYQHFLNSLVWVDPSGVLVGFETLRRIVVHTIIMTHYNYDTPGPVL